MEPKRYFKQTYAQEHWYKYDYAFTFVMTAIMLVFLAGMIFMMYAGIYPALTGEYLTINSVSGYFMVLSGLLGVSIFFLFMYTYIYHAAEVNFKEDRISAKSIFGLTWSMNLSDIDRIVGEKKFYYWRFILESQDGYRIRISPSIDDGGEMMERVLREATEYRYVDLGGLPKEKEKGWKKAPDKILLAQAQERAEENRKKKETT